MGSRPSRRRRLEPRRALIDTGRTFFQKDPAAAAAWLPTSGLSLEQQRLLGP